MCKIATCHANNQSGKIACHKIMQSSSFINVFFKFFLLHIENKMVNPFLNPYNIHLHVIIFLIAKE